MDAGVCWDSSFTLRCSRMNAQLECFEIQTALCGDYDFAIEHAAR